MLSQPEAISHQNTEVVLVIKALCGHLESGKNWATKFGAIKKKEGWEISKADPKVWMKCNLRRRTKNMVFFPPLGFHFFQFSKAHNFKL